MVAKKRTKRRGSRQVQVARTRAAALAASTAGRARVFDDKRKRPRRTKRQLLEELENDES